MANSGETFYDNFGAVSSGSGGGFGSSDTLDTDQFTTSTSAEELVAALEDRVGIEIENLDEAINVYIGFDDNVTSGNGYRIGPGEKIQMVGYTGPVFIIAESGTPDVAFIEW